MALNDSWKQFFSAVASVISALEVFYQDALYKFTFYLLTLLTYNPRYATGVTTLNTGRWILADIMSLIAHNDRWVT